jgi:hypothetical protein
MPDFGEVIKGRAGAVTTNVDALSSAGLALRNASGQNVALLGAGGGQGTTFYDGVNITGVLDQASATTLAIGTSNATAITLGKAGITTTNAGAFTSSQLLTASLGITVTGGTAATEKIARTAADTLDINNGAIITSATAITLAQATTIGPTTSVTNLIRGGVTPLKIQPDAGTVAGISLNDYSIIEAGSGLARRFRVCSLDRATEYFGCSDAGAVTIPANTTHAVGTAATTTATVWRTRSGSLTQVDAAGGDASGYYGAFTLSSGTEQRWWLISGKSYTTYGGGADTFNILNAALATNLSITQAGAVTIGPASGSVSHDIRIPTNGDYMRLVGAGYSGFHVMDGTAYTIGQDSNNRALRIGSGSGYLTTGMSLAAGGTSWGTYSDERLKRDIKALPYSLNDLLQVQTIAFNYKTDAAECPVRIGFSAQNLIGIIPEAVSVENSEDKFLSVMPTELIPILVKSVQELSAKLDAANAEISALKAA